MNHLKKILTIPFVQSVIVMATGTIGAQLIKMLLSPIITRLYGPEAFGVMGVFLSVIQIITPIAALTYPMAIVLPNSDKNAKKIMKLSIIISLIISLITLIILVLLRNEIVNLFNLEEISFFLYLIPLVIILTTFMQILEQWYIRKKKFIVNAKATFYQSLIIEFSKLGIGIFYPFAAVLIILTALTNGLKGILLYILGNKIVLEERLIEKEHSIKTIAKKYKDFPLWRAPQAFIEATTQSLPVLFLTIFFSPVSAGFYTLCRSVLTLPSTFIGNAVGNVFYPRINEAVNNKENVKRLIIKSVVFLTGIGIIPYGIIIIFGPWLFGIIFGSEWVIAGEYARWLSLWRFFRFINEPCIRAFPVLSAQDLHFKITVIQTIIRLIALALGYYIFNSEIMSVILFSVSGAVINFLIIIITLNLCKRINKIT